MEDEEIKKDFELHKARIKEKVLNLFNMRLITPHELLLFFKAMNFPKDHGNSIRLEHYFKIANKFIQMVYYKSFLLF